LPYGADLALLLRWFQEEPALQFRDAVGAAVEEQNVYLVDIPWLGGGVEASLYYGVANYTALWDSG